MNIQLPNYLVELMIENDEWFRDLIDEKVIESYRLIDNIIQPKLTKDALLYQMDETSYIWCKQPHEQDI
jgi:hypothetical protein